MRYFPLEKLLQNVILPTHNKKETGITPREYWLKRRMDLVQRVLVETDFSIPEITEEFGFTDRSHLPRVMKSITRLTPAAIRKKMTSIRKNEKESRDEN